MLHFSAIGEALRWLRKERGLKQAEVAESAGITSPMLSAYETGKQRPSLATIDKILEALDSDVWELTKALLALGDDGAAGSEAGGNPSDAIARANLETLFTLETEVRGFVGETPEDASAAERSILFRTSMTLLWLLRHLKN